MKQENVIVIMLLFALVYAGAQDFFMGPCENKPFSEILDGICDKTGAKIIYDPEITEIGITLKKAPKVPWRTLIKMLAQKHNCLVENLSKNVIKVSKPPTVTIPFTEDIESKPSFITTGACGDRPFSEIIDAIRDKTGANIIYDAEITEIDVTLRGIENIPWHTTLKILAKEYNCVMENLPGNVIKISKSPTITMTFVKADIRRVIMAIAKIAKISVILGEEVNGRLDLHLANVPLKDALTSLSNAVGCVVLKEGKILRIVSRQRFK